MTAMAKMILKPAVVNAQEGVTEKDSRWKREDGLYHLLRPSAALPCLFGGVGIAVVSVVEVVVNLGLAIASLPRWLMMAGTVRPRWRWFLWCLPGSASYGIDRPVHQLQWRGWGGSSRWQTLERGWTGW